MMFSLIELGPDGIAIIAPKFPDESSPLFVFVVETFFTFIFMTCVLHNVYPRLSI